MDDRDQGGDWRKTLEWGVKIVSGLGRQATGCQGQAWFGRRPAHDLDRLTSLDADAVRRIP